MSAIEWTNDRGDVRYQPVLPDGRRAYLNGAGGKEWALPYSQEQFKKVPQNTAEPWYGPLLYRSKKRAERAVGRQLAQEWWEEKVRMREVTGTERW